MSNEAETQYNPQCGVRRTIFSDEYDFLTKIESVCAKEDGIHFLVRTWKDRIATVRITFLTPSVFRFVMVPEMTAKSHRQTVVEDVPESEFETKNAEFTENEDLYIYETNQLSLHFSKNYWEMSIYQNGKLLTKEQAFDTNVDNRWKQLPTGFRVDASGKSIASFEQFVLFSDEQFWGFGEKFTHFNKRGQRIECWQKDALSTNTEDSYKSHPYFTSSRGYSVLLNTFTHSSFDMGASSWISYQMGSDDPILDYIFLAEESKDYKKLLQQYLQITGQIPMIPQWAFGFWMSKCSYMSRKEVEDVVADAEKFGIGIDVIHIDGWQRQDMSGVWEWDTERFPEPEEMIKELNKKNIHLSLWNYPYLQEDSPAFKELAERGFFIKNKEGHPAMFKATEDSEFLCACFDFTNPEFLAWYEERVKKIVRMGVSVIKTDFSEAVPEDVVFYNGMSGREGHNLLTYLYAKNIYTWMKEICDERGELPMLWGRSGYVGSHTIPAAWAGDSSSDKASHSAILQAGLGMAMSGVSFWGYDLGGFYNTGYIGNEERPSIEDYLSSVQMGLWMPLSRAHGKTPREPWQYGDMALKEVKKWINFRHRLVPYLYHTACQTHQSGIPMIRPLVMEYPKDPIAKIQNLSYMLGDALLISPGFDRDEYELYLPEGRWQDIESKEVYEGMTFVHIENKAFADGGTSLRVFQKEGTSIPLFAQKEVLHVPAQLWKQEDLEFMTFQKKDVD